MISSPVRTVGGVLARFEGDFSDFAESFTAGEYVLWLGSGISRDVVPNVQELLLRVLEMLRTQVDRADPECPYRTALNEALALAGLSRETIELIDLAVPVTSWTNSDSVAWQLTSKYAEVLDIPVAGKPADYLVWSGLDVPGTYGDPNLEPDVEHLCIALLMLEGVINSAVTANWDGLVERALALLTKSPDAVTRIVVKKEDFRQKFRGSQLIKLHGCAVRASEDEDRYRSLLIARKQQISSWAERNENRVMRTHVELLYTDRPSLVMGLSFQDANMHAMIARSAEDLQREWPQNPPAVVLAEEEMQSHHRHVLQVTYRSEYEKHPAEIRESAVLGSYAKPTLIGLVLWTLTDKLLAVLSFCLSGSRWSQTETNRLRLDLLKFRNVLAAGADVDNRAFLTQLIDQATLVLGVFRTGSAPSSGGANYEPMSEYPIRDALQSANFPSGAFGRLAVAISLLGRGHMTGDWTVRPGTTGEPEDGVVRISTASHEVGVFIVKDARAAIQLTVDGLVDEDDSGALVVLAEREPVRSVRSPRPRYGRVGAVGAGRVSVEDLCSEVNTADDLYNAFKLVGGF